MTTTRRSAMAMLGLAPAAAIGAETFVGAKEEPGLRAGITEYRKEVFAAALEKLAAQVRAEKVTILSVNVTSRLDCDNIVGLNDLMIRFHYDPDVA